MNYFSFLLFFIHINIVFNQNQLTNDQISIFLRDGHLLLSNVATNSLKNQSFINQIEYSRKISLFDWFKGLNLDVLYGLRCVCVCFDFSDLFPF
jgi:hypothetical protein